MKRFLPLILLILGIAVLGLVFFVNKSRKTPTSIAPEEEKALIEVSQDKRPVVSLTPTQDGHYLKLKVGKLNLINAVSLDYKLEYKVPGSPDQGVPGTVKLAGKDNFEADLLLGSESSGKFRYDEGVKEGLITLSYRNSDGKLLARFKSDFHLQNQDQEITSLDGKLKYSQDSKKLSKDFFITMETIGFPKEPPVNLELGPYGIFSSSKLREPGSISLGFAAIYFWDGNNWQQLSDNKSSDIGLFLGSSE